MSPCLEEQWIVFLSTICFILLWFTIQVQRQNYANNLTKNVCFVKITARKKQAVITMQTAQNLNTITNNVCYYRNRGRIKNTEVHELCINLEKNPIHLHYLFCQVKKKTTDFFTSDGLTSLVCKEK